ncbi:hypothetical protein COLO4_25146 [Corchorus olitorius]|uniref:DUF6821 domain-containing protein n=1 Tax=Corchorus olitorius TaxID=93759 RepID=A0A1R3I4H4_9ROSI|nr:hypothetical protein COLO4_25146 [Corchorus olitorius]
MEGELLDWEVLHNSDSDSNTILVHSPELRNLDEIEADTEGMIRSDYFSLDNQSMYAKEGDMSEEGSVESDNPSWIDPRPETRFRRKNSGEFWSDSASDRSDDRKFSDFDVKNDLGLAENEKAPVEYEGIGEMESGSEKSGKFKLDDSKISELDEKKELGFGEIRVQDKNLGQFWSDSGGNGLVSMRFEDAEKESDIGLVSMKFVDAEKEDDIGFGDCMKRGAELANREELDEGSGSTVELEGGQDKPIGSEGVTDDEMKLCVKSVDEGDKKRVVWWKVPFELLRYCVFKVSPVWSFSVAAAVMGFVILGHRLYKMKRKSRNLQLKVTMDDKKVSQFMTRAARLNEAFSVVRRVPIIRPSLPATGVNPWPVMSMR